MAGETKQVLVAPGVEVTIRRASPQVANRLRYLHALRPTTTERSREIAEILGDLIASPIDQTAIEPIRASGVSDGMLWVLYLVQTYGDGALLLLLSAAAGPKRAKPQQTKARWTKPKRRR